MVAKQVPERVTKHAEQSLAALMPERRLIKPRRTRTLRAVSVGMLREA
jgi:hypothetical protein